MIQPLGKNESNSTIVQLVRIPACHAGGRGFESRWYCIKQLRRTKSKRRVSPTTINVISAVKIYSMPWHNMDILAARVVMKY